MLVPAGLSVEQAAGVAETWLTAFQLLHFVGSVVAGDIVLVHAGGSGVGLAATQLAKAAGARVFVTAGSEEKIDSVNAPHYLSPLACWPSPAVAATTLPSRA